MYIVVIGWLFVVVLMAAAEAVATSVTGGLMTLVFYGLLPVGIFIYLFDARGRRRRRERRETEAARQNALAGEREGDAGRLPGQNQPNATGESVQPD